MERDNELCLQHDSHLQNLIEIAAQWPSLGLEAKDKLFRETLQNFFSDDEMSSLWQWLQGQERIAVRSGMRSAREWSEICKTELCAGKTMKKQKYLSLALCLPEAWQHKLAEKRKLIENEHEEMEEGWMLRSELHEKLRKEKQTRQ